MKFYKLILLFIVVSGCNTTVKTFQTKDNNKIGLKSNRFRGTIFKNTYPKEKEFIASTDNVTRFTPTGENIEKAEAILKKQIKQVNNPRINQFGKHQYIDKNLNKYFRQYIGFVNNQGDSVVHINFCWDKFTLLDRLKAYDDMRLNYESDFVLVMDGGSHYWNINVNITKGTLYNLAVNGVAFKKRPISSKEFLALRE